MSKQEDLAKLRTKLGFGKARKDQTGPSIEPPATQESDPAGAGKIDGLGIPTAAGPPPAPPARTTSDLAGITDEETKNLSLSDVELISEVELLESEEPDTTPGTEEVGTEEVQEFPVLADPPLAPVDEQPSTPSPSPEPGPSSPSGDSVQSPDDLGIGTTEPAELSSFALSQQTPIVVQAATAPATGAAKDEINWKEERTFYVEEATALVGRQPERAALLWLQAALCCEILKESPLPDLESALSAANDSLSVVSAVRRRMQDLGHHEQALALTERQLFLGGDNDDRCAALLEASSFVRHCGDGSRALELLRQATELRPGYVPALFLMLGLHIELGHDRAAAETAERLSEVLTDPKEQALCLHLAGTLREARLKQNDPAARDFSQALELDPSNEPVLLAHVDLKQQQADWSGLPQALEQLAAITSDDQARAQYLRSAGIVCLLRLEAYDDALDYLAKAASIEQEDSTALSRMAHIYEALGRHQQLVDTLHLLSSLVPDARGQAAVLCRMGWILQRRLGKPAEAVVAYQRALQARPGHAPALRALRTLYRQERDRQGLLALLQSTIEGTTDGPSRFAACIEGAELLRQQAEPAEAITTYRRALELSPGHPLAFWPLRDLLRDQQHYGDLADFLAEQATHSRDPATRQHLLLELAQLQTVQLQTPEAAAKTLKEAEQLGSSRSASLGLVDLYRQQGQLSELAEQLLHVAQRTSDNAEQHAFQLQAASILADDLGEHERAASLLVDILGQDPGNYCARWALEGVHHRLGRWNDLVQLLRQQLELQQAATTRDSARQADLWCEIGGIYDDQLGHPSDAITAYLHALEHDPTSQIAVGALERLAPREQRVDELIEVLVKFADAATEPLAATDSLCRAAELADHCLDDLARATKLYQAALKRIPKWIAALHGLYGVQRRQQRTADAAQTLRRLISQLSSDDERQHRGQLEIILARLDEHWLGKEANPELYRRLTMAGQETLRQEWIRTLRLVDRGDPLAEALLWLGSHATDSAMATSCLLEASHRFEMAGESDARLKAAELAFRHDAHDPAVIRCLERGLSGANKWRELGSLMEHAASHETDASLRLQSLTDAAATYLHADQLDDAMRQAHCCLDTEAHHLPALRLLASIARWAGDWTALASWHDRLAAACTNIDNRLKMALTSSKLWAERCGDTAKALASLQIPLEDDPCQAEAFARAEELLLKTEQFVRLSELYSERISHTSDAAKRLQLLQAHAHLLRDKIQDPLGAVIELTALLELEPEHVQALTEQAALLGQLERWSDAAAALSKLVELADDDETQQSARLDLGRILFEELHDTEQAREVLAEALELGPSATGPRRILVKIAVAEGHWEQAQQLLETLASSTDAKVASWAMYELAQVARIGFQDAQLQLRWEKEALALAPTDPEALQQIVAAYRQRNRLERFVKIANELVVETSKADVAGPLRLAVAEVLLADLRKPGAALELLRECMVAAAGDPRTTLLFGQALEQHGSSEEALAAYRALLRRDSACIEAYRGIQHLAPLLGLPAIAASATAALHALGAASPAEQAQLASADSRGTPSGQLDVAQLPADELNPDVRQILDLVAPHLGNAFPFELDEDLGNSHPVAGAAIQVASVLGLGTPKLSVQGDSPALPGVGIPTRLHISAVLAKQPRSPAFRFWVGHAMASASTGGALVAALSDSDLNDLLQALLDPSPALPALQQLRKRCLRSLPRKVRKQLEPLGMPKLTAQAWNVYREAELARADRVGLILSGSPQVAFAEIAKTERTHDKGHISPRLAGLLRFATSETYPTFYRAVWSS